MEIECFKNACEILVLNLINFTLEYLSNDQVNFHSSARLSSMFWFFLVQILFGFLFLKFFRVQLNLL
jgi:hypothetical protein